MGVLLYAGPGLMRSLTLILGVEAGAFGVGLWAASRPGRDPVESVRRRWLLCLTAFLLASVFAAAWSVVEEVGGRAVGQGLGLAFLAALPLYAAGSVVATIGGAAHRDRRYPFQVPGAPAAIGAATGFVVTGVVLPHTPSPTSLLLGCMVLLSLGGLVQGTALARRPALHVRARRPEAFGTVRIEDRGIASAGLAVRFLFEGVHARRWLHLTGDALVPWEVALVRALLPDEGTAFRVLLVGGGGSALPRDLVRMHPLATIDVVERSAAVVELGREHLDTGLSVGVNGRGRVLVGNLDDLVGERTETYDLILLDLAALAPLGGTRGVSRATQRRLASLLAPGGVIAWGGVTAGVPAPDPAGAFAYTTYRRPFPPGTASVVGFPAYEILWIGRRHSDPSPPDRIPDFEAEVGVAPIP